MHKALRARRYTDLLSLLLASVYFVSLTYSSLVSASAEVYAKVRESVYVLESQRQGRPVQGGAVAFMVNSGSSDGPTTLLATNAHLVEPDQTVRLRQAGVTTTAQVVFSDAESDIAIVRALGELRGRGNAIPEASLRVGQSVFAVGAPLGLEGSISEGLLSAKRQSGDFVLLQTTAPISPGNSGGGLFNADGGWIGVTSFRLREGQNLNFAIAADAFMRIALALDAAKLLSLWLTGSATAAPPGNQIVKWLAFKYNGDGLMRFDEVYRIFEGIASKSISERQAEMRLSAVFEAYRQFAGSAGVAAPAPAAGVGSHDSRSTAITALSCEAEVTPGNRRVMTFEVDLDKQTVNGLPAQVTSRTVRFGDERFVLEIDRYTLALSGISHTTGITRTVGQCRPASARQF
jgi:S1-C subfamily serine protease